MVEIYTMHIFNRKGTCLYYQEWNRPLPVRGDLLQEHKLMFGFLFSLKQLVSKMSPKKGGGFYACSTSAFKLNYFETASGIRFVLCTELGAGDMREVLRHIFSNIFVECLTKNPMWKADEPISCPLFVQQLTNYLDGI
uniref:Trafficking protein particle complex subunit n=2 Tax=Chrysotila carterae TaxID=13221 RepID=A0A7S4B046_CHRCT|mmetsp:Transcript_13924/g.27238  ORF Transcript_13924/g.27238 Transcript_13924/m.27238 type:complete len:138 (-) Transcript_13924:189-602(-)